MRRSRLPTSRAGRALLAFWVVLLIAALALAGALQWLGPPARPRAHPALRTPVAPAQHATKPAPPPRHEIAAPEAALLEPAPLVPGGMLPRIAADGQQARIAYAAPVPAVPNDAKRIAILLDGIGLSAAESYDAIDRLPGAISLAVSPYAVAPGPLLDAARRAGHEVLLSLPMEPAAAPLDDEGGEALTEQVTSDDNRKRLQWALSRVQGYAGVTNAFVGMRGERFAASGQFDEVARILSERGLFYLDAAPGATAPAGVQWGVPWADADLRLDDPPDAGAIDRQLASLEQIAQSKGSAIGVAGPLFPVTIGRLADWARRLTRHGFVLVPVSSLVHIPPLPVTPPTQGSKHAPG